MVGLEELCANAQSAPAPHEYRQLRYRCLWFKRGAPCPPILDRHTSTASIHTDNLIITGHSRARKPHY